MQFLKTTCGVILLLIAFVYALAVLGVIPRPPEAPLPKPPADAADAAGALFGKIVPPIILALGGYWLVRRRKPKKPRAKLSGQKPQTDPRPFE